jgi:peroxiredoxin Q/BCP
MAYITTWTSKYQPGKKAPSFKAILQDGTSISSDDLKGKHVVLFFYNHDGTQTCTIEACNIRDHFTALKKAGYTVIGASVDSEKKHQNFIKKHDLPFPLISDKDNALAKKFDIYGEKKFMGRISDAVHRTTFVIDKDWKIEKTIHPVISKNHASQILGVL